MGRALSPQRVNDFLGSAQVFSSAVTDIIEEKLLREVSGAALTLSQFKLLKLVANTGAHSIGDVAAFLGVSNAAASKAVDKLVRRGLIVRAEGVTDRRAVDLSLTPQSLELLDAYDAARDSKLAHIFQSFTRGELEQTEEILDRLSAGILGPMAQSEEYCFRCGIYFREKCSLRKLPGRRCTYVAHRARARHEGAAGVTPPATDGPVTSADSTGDGMGRT